MCIFILDPRPFETTAWYTLFVHVHNISMKIIRFTSLDMPGIMHVREQCIFSSSGNEATVC